MTKRELIDEIVAINQTAQPQFLARFEDGELGDYLRHLQVVKMPRLTGDAGRYDRYFACYRTTAAVETKSAAVAECAAVAIAAVETVVHTAAEPAIETTEPGRFESHAVDGELPLTIHDDETPAYESPVDEISDLETEESIEKIVADEIGPAADAVEDETAPAEAETELDVVAAEHQDKLAASAAGEETESWLF